jgi:GNAT superfamily N-acetyltransferase
MVNRIENSQFINKPELKAKLQYLEDCWLFLPEQIMDLPKKQISNWAQQISSQIDRLGHGHMFACPAEEVQADLIQGMAMALTDPDKKQVLSFIKKMAWPNCNGIACWEIGSLFTDPLVQNLGVGRFMINSFCKHSRLMFALEPVISVVTADNTPSLAVFRACKWTEIQPTTEECSNFFAYDINNANIFKDWGLPSSIFVLPKLLVK